MELKEYIRHSRKVLKDLFLYKYLTQEEKDALNNAPSEIAADRLVHTYRDKYFDIMYEDYEVSIGVKSAEEDEVDTSSIEYLELKKRTFLSLKRAHIDTIQSFIDFVNLHGWNKIRGFGRTAAVEVIEKVMDVHGKELADMVNKLKEPNKYKEFI